MPALNSAMGTISFEIEMVFHVVAPYSAVFNGLNIGQYNG